MSPDVSHLPNPKIKNADELCRYLENLDLEQCISYLNEIKPDLNQFIQYTMSLISIVHSIKQEQRLQACQIIMPESMALLETFLDLSYLLDNFEASQYADIFCIIDPIIHTVIKHSNTLDSLLRLFKKETEQAAIVNYMMAEVIPNIMKKSSDFEKLVVYLTLEQRWIIFQKKESEIFQNAANLKWMLHGLNFNQREKILSKISPMLLNKIIDVYDLLIFLEALYLNECSEVIKFLMPNLPNIIQSIDQLLSFLSRLYHIEQQDVLNAILPFISKWDVDPYDLYLVHQKRDLLAPHYYVKLTNALKYKLWNQTKTIPEVTSLLPHLTIDERYGILTKIELTLPFLKPTWNEISSLIEKLNPEESIRLAEMMLPILKDVITNHNNFFSLLSLIQPSSYHSTLTTMNEMLVDISKDQYEFARLFDVMKTEEKMSKFLLFLRPNLIEFIHSDVALEALLKCSDVKNRMEILKVFQSKLWDFITNIKAVSSIFKLLSYEEFKWLLEIIKSKVIDITYSDVEDLIRLITPLSEDKHSYFIQLILPDYNKFLRTGEDLIRLYRCINSKQQYIQILIHNIPTLTDMTISSGAELGCMLEYIPFDARKKTLDGMKPKMATIVKSGSDLRTFLNYLNDDESDDIFGQMYPYIANILKDGMDIIMLISALKDHQLEQIYNQLKEKIYDFLIEKYSNPDITQNDYALNLSLWGTKSSKKMVGLAYDFKLYNDFLIRQSRLPRLAYGFISDVLCYLQQHQAFKESNLIQAMHDYGFDVHKPTKGYRRASLW